MRLLVDPGHGGKDSGAVSSDGETLEKDVVWDISNRVMVLLGMKADFIAMSREEDDFVNLSERAAIANRTNCDLLSIHANAGGGHGMEVFSSPGITDSDRWATDVLSGMADACPGQPLRVDFSDGDSDKEAKFTVLTRTKGSAILVEVGFMDSEKGIAFLRGEKNRQRLAEGIAAGTLKFYGREGADEVDEILTFEQRLKRLEDEVFA
jgi:N-acetylmuramoyl-L-alanine amidase